MKKLLRISLCLFTALYGPIAFGQDGSSGATGDETTLPPMVVTEEAPANEDGYVADSAGSASKSETPIIETPQSISIVTREQMDDQNIESLAEALRYTPGVQGENFGYDPRTTFLRFRGFNSYEDALYRDGLKLANPGFLIGYNVEPYGAERLEVPRGPASVLYGQANPGGLVNYISKRPPSERLGELTLEAGRYDRYQGQFDVGGPLDDGGHFLYRFTGLYRESDTQVDYVEDDRLYLAPAFTWRLSDDTSLTLLAHYQYDITKPSQRLPERGTLEENPFGDIPSERFTGEPDVDQYERSEYALGYLFQHRFDESLEFRQKARYYHIDVDDRTIYPTSLLADNRTVTRALYESFGELDGVHIDNQLHLDLETGSVAHHLLFGADYQYTEVSTLQTFGGAPALDIFDPVYGMPVGNAPVFRDDDITVSQLGLYLQDEIYLTEQWILVLGGRYDWADTETENKLTDMTLDQDDESFTWRTGLIYRSDIGISPYVSYQTSWLPVIGTDPTGQPFEPEEARQFEGGVKFQPEGWNSFLTVAYFDLVRENFLTPDPSTFANVQQGEARTRGLEVEANSDFECGLSLIASYTYYIQREVTESSFPADEGETLAYTPRNSAGLWAEYEFQPESGLDGFSVGFGARYIGESFGSVYAGENDTLEVPDVWLFDAALGYAWDNVRVDLNVHNLTDEEYFASAFGSFGSNFATFGPRRTVSASLTYTW